MEQNFELISNFKTWKTDNTGIFDYVESKVSYVNHKTTEEDTYYARSNNYTNTISIYSSQIGVPNESTILFRARKNKEKKYEIINTVRKKMKKNINNINNLDNKMWLVLNSINKTKYENKNKPYYLMENDIIKLGRKKYEIIKLNVPTNSSPYYGTNTINYINQEHGPVFDITLKPNQYCNEIINNNINEEKENSESFVLNESYSGYNTENDCRICFGAESTEENPKLRICNCHTYIHYNCLKMFLKSNITIEENQKGTVTSYYCQKFNCEVCEQPYPLKFQIKFKGKNEPKTYYLIDGLELPENTNYMILESLIYEKENKNIKNIFVVKLIDEEITLGRSNKNDIIESDISVSRYHAIIKFNKESGEVTISNQSRFGVLVLIKDNVKLVEDEKIYFQVGRTYINVYQKEISVIKENFLG